MFRSYKLLAAHLLTRWWPWVILFWVTLAIGLRLIAPPWNQIAQDGDFQFMPSTLPSRVGQMWLERGFPSHRTRSQLVIIAARTEKNWFGADIAVPLDLGRRLTHFAGVAAYRRFRSSELKNLGVNAGLEEVRSTKQAGLMQAAKFFDEAIELDQQWFDVVKAHAPNNEQLLSKRLAIAYWDRAKIQQLLGEEEKAKADLDTAKLISPEIGSALEMTKRLDFDWSSLVDVWTWRDPVLGSKLGEQNNNAKLISLQLNTEFISTKNIQLLTEVEKELEASRQLHREIVEPGMELAVSGSAAVGGDMLRAAAESVRQTELVTILLILIILAVIYRGPLLVAIPIATIGLSLFVATSMISLLAVDPNGPKDQIGLQVFTTTRIFLVVLLFGAGTDFCLFLIARCREQFTKNANPSRKQVQRMVASSWFSVHDALLGSALTTIVGLGLMFFSDFAKFRFTGLIIGLGLSVTILVCLTFTPAILCGLGRFAFWPTLGQSGRIIPRAVTSSDADEGGRWTGFWEWVADWVVSRPRTTLVLGLILLGIPAVQGWLGSNSITYDFAHELSPSSPSRVGTSLVENFFNTRDSTPVTVVVTTENASTDDKALRGAIESLRRRLYVKGVTSVRSLTDPLGDYPPDRRMSLFDQDAWRRRLLENHRMTQQLYVATNPLYVGRIARLDVLLEPSPFSMEAESILLTLRKELEAESLDKDSPWYQATFACTGTTPGIFDLKSVTQADQRRIQILVTLGVGMVLVMMLRKWWISFYLIFTVLLSYFTTLGLTLWFFGWAYGDDFVGLDWKVPLFLFVILVAVGQDYNVYLTTRVIEEQARFGPIQGLRRAMVLTGGIITSCGIVMAGTFASMTSGAICNWLATVGFPEWMVGDASTPVLRGVVELGFALSLGVLIDTLIVRTILVPAMFAWLTRRGKFVGRAS